MKLRYTPAAIADLQGIRQYIGNTLHSPAAAARITGMILDRCAALKDFPMSGASISARTGYDTELRMLVCAHYVAIYRVETDVISVARILHAKQDYMRILFRDFDGF